MQQKKSKQKFIILVTVLIDVIGMSIIIPVMPYFVEKLGASAFTITTIFAIFALCSFLSAPLLGALSDKYGRRPALIVSLASTAIGWFVFGSAKTILFLFLGRIIDGMAAGNFPIAQSYIADISETPAERTQNMGLIGTAFGVGFIIGPAIGAALSVVSLSFPFYFVGVLATLNTIGAYFFLPETNTNKQIHKQISLNPFTPVVNAMKDKTLRIRYIVLFLFGLAFAAQQSVFALYMQNVFGFGVTGAGIVMAGLGLCMIINQVYLLRHVWLKKFSEASLEVWLLLAFAIGFFTMSIPVLILFCLGLVIMIFAQSIFRAVIASRITGFAGPHKKGEVSGMMNAFTTLGMVVGPLAIGTVYSINPQLPFIISGIVLVIAFIIMYFDEGIIPESKYHHVEAEPVETIA